MACAAGTALLLAYAGVASGEKLKTKSASDTIASGDTGVATAQCPKGTKALSGGFETEFVFGSMGSPAMLTYGSLREGGRKWTSSAFNVGAPGDLTSFAYCRDQKVKRRTSETTVAADDTETLSAKCPRGTKAISGGFDNPDFTVTGGIRAIFAYRSMKTGKREWSVSAENIGDDPATLVTQVNCREGKGLKTVQEDFFIDHASAPTVTARCGGKRRVISGGFDYDLTPSEEGFIFESHKEGKREWVVRGLDNIHPATLTSFAYCEKT